MLWTHNAASWTGLSFLQSAGEGRQHPWWTESESFPYAGFLKVAKMTQCSNQRQTMWPCPEIDSSNNWKCPVAKRCPESRLKEDKHSNTNKRKCVYCISCHGFTTASAFINKIMEISPLLCLSNENRGLGLPWGYVTWNHCRSKSITVSLCSVTCQSIHWTRPKCAPTVCYKAAVGILVLKLLFTRWFHQECYSL